MLEQNSSFQSSSKGTDSRLMQVPEHISVMGEPLTFEQTNVSTFMEQEPAVKLMNVPDHIVLTGGNGYKAIVSKPSDIMNSSFSREKEIRLLDLPSKITLEESPYLDRDDYRTVDEHVRSESSIAIDENPLQELKKMRRQLAGVSGRLHQLEDEVDKYKSKEKLLLSTILGITAAVLLVLFRR